AAIQRMARRKGTCERCSPGPSSRQPKAMAMAAPTTISSAAYYGEYHGHRVRHLAALYPRLRSESDALIWTAGDSSLDNKYWFSDRAPAVEGAHASLLRPPTSVCDVTYWLNELSFQRDAKGNGGGGVGDGCISSGGGEGESGHEPRRTRPRYAAVNTAVEATTLNERCRRLRPQDRFLRDRIGPDDVLIVSIGGNDIALAPAPCTIASLAGLMCLPSGCLEGGRSYGSCPINDFCCGCGPSLASCACSCPPCLGYFRHLFGTRTQKYIEALTAKTKPKKILVCMIYYPDENNVPSWANGALGALGYNSNPTKVQLLIRKIFEEATCTIKIPGSEVVPIPLFHTLDGTRSEDYIARVEPSAAGGRKMAEYFLDVIHSGSAGLRSGAPSTWAPTASFIEGRVA
ncbi:hypothetical protein ACHAWF_005229, partial [Thalassiosira exigua]